MPHRKQLERKQSFKKILPEITHQCCIPEESGYDLITQLDEDKEEERVIQNQTPCWLMFTELILELLKTIGLHKNEKKRKSELCFKLIY